MIKIKVYKFYSPFNLIATSFFSKKDKKRAVILTLSQMLINFLDLFAIALVGVLTALSVTGVKSQKPGEKIVQVLSWLQIENLKFQIQVAIIAISVALIFVLKTIFSLLISRSILFFLSYKSAEISSAMIKSILYQKVDFLKSCGSQDLLFASTRGVQGLLIGVLGGSMVLVADIFLVLIVSLALIAVNWLIGTIAIFLFSAVGFIVHKILTVRASIISEQISNLEVLSNKQFIESLETLNEIKVKGRISFYSSAIGKTRFAMSEGLAEMSNLPNMTKYILEFALVISALLLAAVEFLFQDAIHAVSTLTIFLAAGFRLTPAVLRIQNGFIVIKSGMGTSRSTLNLLNRIENYKEEPNRNVGHTVNRKHEKFVPEIQVSKLIMKFRDSPKYILNGIDLDIKSGQFIAVVGPSGSGKSTLAGVILGLLKPESGFVKISGLSPEEAIRKWPGAIGYVPQNSFLIDGTIEQNVALGFEQSDANKSWIDECLAKAALKDFVSTLELGQKTEVGERGIKLSGGQRQRLGIARALFTNPKILILDEATSALDGQTENLVTDYINSLHGSVTTIVIAHRLSTVQKADKVIYLENGLIKASGSFLEVCQQVPNFANQARNLIK